MTYGGTPALRTTSARPPVHDQIGESMGFFQFVQDRWVVLLGDSWQHFSLVAQSLVLSTVIGLALAVLVYRSPIGSGVANAFSAIGLTLPSYALLGVMVGLISLGVLPSVIGLVFYGSLPIMRNAIVGLHGVDKNLIESARGMGMGPFTTLWRLEIPLAWPIVMTGIRISGQMLMGIAAIAAFVLGPGLGGLIFSGISRQGGANATNSVVAGTVGVLILAVVLDLLLSVVSRLTTSRGIRV
ncbi:MAG: ABC transporter permease [Nocardioidaceae bacterium]|nr:ABC transporter permease [Nocardioidaceae bacterium]